VKTLREAHVKLKAANQALARTTPGSKGRQRARARLAKTHRKVANTRRYLVHEASKTLVNRAQVIALEELNVAGMVRNRRLARSISDAAMGELARQILYKAKWHDVEVRMVDRFYPSSKTCSSCGNVKRELNLNERIYYCTHCDLAIDRDHNAAINLARWQPKDTLVRVESPPKREQRLSKA